MSRRYSMNILVTCTEENKDTVYEVLNNLWCIDDSNYDSDQHVLFVWGEDYLHGGQTEEEFADKIAGAIWEKIGYTLISIDATYIENPPFETHIRDEEAFKKYEMRKLND